MISLPENIEVLVAADFVDMRKQIDGLCILVCDDLKQSPQSQTVFVFYNRSRDKVKLLVWDREDPYVISQAQLKWLLAGLDFVRLADHPECHFRDYI